MFDELPCEALRGVTGGFAVDPAVMNMMMSTFQQALTARNAALHSLNRDVMHMFAFLAAARAARNAAPTPMAPITIAPIAPANPMSITPAPSASDVLYPPPAS